jgi:hypothetical protein
MAEKHKSKYKAPKDLEKSQKPKPRKDLKDYTEEDKAGNLNPKSTGEKQQNVLRKTDKEMVDDGKLYKKYNADDQLYKDLEDGEYDPKHAAKVLKKRQDADEKDNAKNIKDKIENLTREQKERFVREYVRRKLDKIITEQTDPAAEEPAEDPAAPAPDATAPIDAAPVPDPAAAPTDTAPVPDPAMAPDAAATPDPAMTPDATAPAPDATAPATDAAATQPTPEELENRNVTNVANDLAKEGNVGKIKMLNKMINLATKEIEPEDKATFYKLLRSFAIKKLGTTNTEQK